MLGLPGVLLFGYIGWKLAKRGGIAKLIGYGLGAYAMFCALLWVVYLGGF